MKTLFACLLLFFAAHAFGALANASGNRLTDYEQWFDAFAMTYGDDPAAFPHPPGQPDGGSIDNEFRTWSGWTVNAGATQLEPPNGGIIEIVFLGQSSAYLNDWGIATADGAIPLAQGISTSGDVDSLWFGDHTAVTMGPWESFDIWFRFRPDKPSEGGEPYPSEPTTYYLFDQSRNTSATDMPQSYYGTLIPDGSVLPYWNSLPFTIVAFEEEPGGGDGDYNDLIFAYRTWGNDIPVGPTIPEPATYGLLGAGALLALLARRRRQRAEP